MAEHDDWRLHGQEHYLSGQKLYYIPFQPLSGKWDHEHCEFCWDKFMLHPECLQKGYCTKPQNQRDAHWICPACYEDFREKFDWTLD